MKNNAPYIVIILTLGLVFGWMYYHQSKENHSDEMNFAVSDPKDIYSIEISNKYNQKVNLSKKGNTWMVNHRMPADYRKIKAILEVLEKLKVESLVTKENRKKIIDGLRQNSIKVVLKDKDGDEIKTVHIGDRNIAMTGSYMILEKEGKVAPNPYIVNISGYNGALKYYFSTDSFDLWSQVVFQTAIDQIEYIEVNYPSNPKASFKINKDEGMVKIIPFVDSIEIKQTPNKAKMTNFLLNFEFANVEGWIKEDSTKMMMNRLPIYCSILVRDVEGQERKGIFYRKPADSKNPIRGKNGETIPFDIERLFCLTSPEKKYALVQYYTFGPVLRDYAYFFE